jgi:hypothetical protein
VTAIVDLRRPVRVGGLMGTLRSRGDVYALSPLACWLLERAGLPFRTSEAFLDDAWFRREGLANTGRLEQAFRAAFGGELDPWYGLLYQLKMAADYALIEEKRWAFARAERAWIYSDLEPSSCDSDDYTAHHYNRAALYFRAVPRERRIAVPRARQLPQALQRLRRGGVGAVIRRAAGALRRAKTKPGLVTDWAGDWAALRPELEPRYAAYSASELAREALALGVAEPDRSAADALISKLRPLMREVLPNAYDAFEEIVRRETDSYTMLAAALRRGLPRLQKDRDLRGALSVVAGMPDLYLVNHQLKRMGLPTIFYQHGGYQARVRLLMYGERHPATHNLVYGRKVREFYEPVPGGPVVDAGSLALGLLRPEPRGPGNKFLYVLFHNQGNPTFVDSDDSMPWTDPARLFTVHRRVIELFARHPRASLVIREHPCHKTFCLYEPLREVIASLGARNITLDETVAPPGRYLKGYGTILFDYAATGLLQALALGQRVICLTGAPYNISLEYRRDLQEAALAPEGVDEFLADIESVLGGRLPDLPDDGRRRYLEVHGGPPKIGAADIERLLA